MLDSFKLLLFGFEFVLDQPSQFLGLVEHAKSLLRVELAAADDACQKLRQWIGYVFHQAPNCC